jgi:4'-phosphopantetheinyl transferase
MPPRPNSLAPWPNPPSPLPGLGRQVHVWRVRLDPPPAALRGRFSALAPEDHARAGQRSGSEQQRYLAAHVALRSLLGAYCGCEPRALRFAYGPHGKPSLADWPGLHFNLAHSGDVALCGVTRLGPLGVDVEAIRPLDNLAAVAGRFCSDGERESLLALPPDAQPEAFFSLWTRKEAVIKALGQGLGLGPRNIRVSQDPAEYLWSIQLPTHLEPGAWQTLTLRPGAGYTGALIWQGTPADTRRWEWSWD